MWSASVPPSLFLPLLLLLVSLSHSTAESQPGPSLGESFYSLLNVTMIAAKDDIKRAYRKLILELHPDKFSSQNLTAEEEEITTNRFIRVTEAYEVLIDDERRKKYDFSLDGIEYQFLELQEEQEFYKKKPFKVYSKSGRSRLYFEAEFADFTIPDLLITLTVDIKESLSELKRVQRFFRRKVCPECKGVGGIPKECSDCQGSGIGKSCFAGQVHEGCISTTCVICAGKGILLNSKCSLCSAKGFIMEEGSVEINIPAGTKDGHRISIENAGHEARDGSKGRAVLELQYTLPPGWSLDAETGCIMHDIVVPIESLLGGYNETIVVPTGESVEVRTNRYVLIS
jgi:DnaJ-class molecular chaperone